MQILKRASLLLLTVLALGLTAGAQRVDPRVSHRRIIAIDRYVQDSNGVRRPAHADGMLAYIAIQGPANSNLCLVEYVAKTHADFDGLRADFAKEKDKDKDSKFKHWDKSLVDRDEVEAAAKAVGFVKVDFDRLFVRVK